MRRLLPVLALAGLAACGGSPVGPSPVDAPTAPTAPAGRPMPAFPDGLVLLTDGVPKHWAGGPMHHCFSPDESYAAEQQRVADLMTAVSGIPQTSAGPCNVSWSVVQTAENPYTTAYGTLTEIFKADVHLTVHTVFTRGEHEAGHVLGLGHTTLPNFCMSTPAGGTFHWTPVEVAALSWIYGR